jgi:hypothetical protein
METPGLEIDIALGVSAFFPPFAKQRLTVASG